MEIKNHQKNSIEIAEIITDRIVIQNAEDALDLLGNVYYQGYDKMIMHEKNINPDFFDLKNKLAGEFLQKFSNYRVSLASVCDFLSLSSESLSDFIYESNKGRHVNFVASIDEAIITLCR